MKSCAPESFAASMISSKLASGLDWAIFSLTLL
ncbi:Uncharacterised protein [Vibrio cholerae]|nr:Uncharacterised protein [Vibrio cholerae]